MNIQEALILVRNKYLEEQKGVIDSNTTENYNKACKDYPATLKIAHIVFALEFSKTR